MSNSGQVFEYSSIQVDTSIIGFYNLFFAFARLPLLFPNMLFWIHLFTVEKIENSYWIN